MNTAEELLCDFPLPDTVCDFPLDDTEVVTLLKRAEMLTHQALAAAQRSGLSPSALSHMEILSDVTAECIDVVAAPPREVDLNLGEKAIETIIISGGAMADEAKTQTRTLPPVPAPLRGKASTGTTPGRLRRRLMG